MCAYDYIIGIYVIYVPLVYENEIKYAPGAG